MKSLSKVAAVMLAASIMFSMAACNKGGSKGHSGQKITSDMPWFEANPFEVKTGIDPDKQLEFNYSQLIGSDEKQIAVLTQGSYKYPENVDWSTFDYNAYQISGITLVDKATRKTAKYIDLMSLKGIGYVDSASYSDGKITLDVSEYDDKTNSMTSKSIDFDPETEKVLETRENKSSDSIQNVFTIGKYKVQLLAIWTEAEPVYSMNIISPDGEQNKIDFKDEASKISYVESIIPLDEKTGLIVADTDSAFAFFRLDLATGKITKEDSKNYDWLDFLAVYRMRGCSDGNVYSIDSTGLTKVDFKKKAAEEVLNFSWCNIDRNLANSLMVADVYDDSIILYGEKMKTLPYTNSYGGSSADFVMYEMKKADKNPHEGKTILELFASSGYVSEDINNAITKYNESNKDYFIEVTDRYSSNVSSEYRKATNDDESNEISLKYMADMSNKLAMDIMNGEGPDMLLNIDGYGALKNSNYLMDLSDYTSNMKSDKYFTNVLDAMKTDGKLYSMPISFGLFGIQTDAKYAATTGVGFTTDEYVKFLKDTLNGKDLNTSGQAHYFAGLFDNMSGKFISNKKADFSGPEFAALAEFVKDNVQEKSPDWTQDDRTVYIDSSTPTEMQKAVYGSFSGYWDYIQAVENTRGCTSILGTPSSDGRGPTVYSYDSLAISAQAKSADACADFLKLLISDETQQEIATRGYFVLNREIFRETGIKAFEYFNTINPAYPFGYYGDGPKPKNYVKYTAEQLDALEKVIESCTNSNFNDAAISIILVEEMPSYFTGQKDLDDVIKIAQDRVQKVLDERK